MISNNFKRTVLGIGAWVALLSFLTPIVNPDMKLFGLIQLKILIVIVLFYIGWLFIFNKDLV